MHRNGKLAEYSEITSSKELSCILVGFFLWKRVHFSLEICICLPCLQGRIFFFSLTFRPCQSSSVSEGPWNCHEFCSWSSNAPKCQEFRGHEKRERKRGIATTHKERPGKPITHKNSFSQRRGTAKGSDINFSVTSMAKQAFWENYDSVSYMDESGMELRERENREWWRQVDFMFLPMLSSEGVVTV